MLLLLHLTATCSWPVQLISSDATDLGVRQAASVNFKNTVKFRWVSGWLLCPACHVVLSVLPRSAPLLEQVPSEADIYGGALALPDDEKVCNCIALSWCAGTLMFTQHDGHSPSHSTLHTRTQHPHHSDRGLQQVVALASPSCLPSLKLLTPRLTQDMCTPIQYV